MCGLALVASNLAIRRYPNSCWVSGGWPWSRGPAIDLAFCIKLGSTTCTCKLVQALFASVPQLPCVDCWSRSGPWAPSVVATLPATRRLRTVGHALCGWMTRRQLIWPAVRSPPTVVLNSVASPSTRPCQHAPEIWPCQSAMSPAIPSALARSFGCPDITDRKFTSCVQGLRRH